MSRIKSRASIGEQTPLVSILLPVRNEAQFIERCLAALDAQTYPRPRIEIIVADGQSGDQTAAIVRARAQADRRIRLINNPQRIVSTGLNAALRAAGGEILIRVDGHCEIEPDYVANCVRHLLSGRADCVGGPIITLGSSPVARAIALAMSSWFGVGGSAFRVLRNQQRYVDTVAFSAYRREVVGRIGLIDEELVRNQDDEYNFRLRAHGGRVLLTPDLVTTYHSRSSYRSLGRQYFQYGFWKVRVMQKHPRQMSWRHFVPPAFVLGLLALALLGGVNPFARGLLIGVLCSYVLACLGATWRAAPPRSRNLWLQLPLAFAVMHFSYGSGFLTGLLHFWRRWGDPLGNVPQWSDG